MNALRPIALLTVMAGAAGSFALMLRVGQRNNSLTLLLLFTLWVLSPFAVLAGANVTSRTWPRRTQNALNLLILSVTVVSLLGYGIVAFGTRISKPASVFLLIPLASWVAIGILRLSVRRRVP